MFGLMSILASKMNAARLTYNEAVHKPGYHFVDGYGKVYTLVRAGHKGAVVAPSNAVLVEKNSDSPLRVYSSEPMIQMDWIDIQRELRPL